MKFGLWTPVPHVIRNEVRMTRALESHQSSTDVNGDEAFAFAVDVIRQAEAFGFHNTLVAQRFLGPDLEAWTLATALAMRTSTIEVMVAVHPGMVSPQVVAKMGATLDRISSGRCAINIVNGHWVEEFQLFSNGSWIADSETRYRRMEEFILVMKGLWTNPDFRFDGEFYRADVPGSLENRKQKVTVPEAGHIQVKPFGHHAPALYAASRAASGKRIIAEHCDAWFAEYRPGYRNFEQNLQKIRDDVSDMALVCERAGRRIGFGLNPLVVCESTMEKAIAVADHIEDPKNADRIANSLGAGLVGTPAVIAERIAKLEEAGIDRLMLRFTPMGEGLQRFGTDVLPLLK
ncbi:MAG: LLM class flavin-dependent oxidoreductase [Beijerinckiaceae bacterium]